MKNNVILIDEHSHIFLSTSITTLLNNYIEEGLLNVTIHVENDFTKEILTEKIVKLKDYFKKDVSIVTSPEYFKGKKTQLTKVRKGTVIGGLISKEYIDEPFIVGKSNELVYTAAQSLLNDKSSSNILFVYGDVGTGKSHLLELTAYQAFQKGKMVYINHTEKFIDDIKAYLSKQENDFFTNSAQIDFFALDDFQFFNRKHLEGFYDILHQCINGLMSRGKKLMFTSDKSPEVLSLFPKRITSRLLSGYRFELGLPENDMKRKYIDHFCNKHDFSITDDLIGIILKASPSLRQLKGYLSTCQILYEKRGLDKQSFVRMAFGKSGDIESLFEKDMTMELRDILREYFGVSEKQTATGKKSRDIAMIDSIIYYLCYETAADKIRLRKLLDIANKHHTHYYRKGEERYNALSDVAFKKKIEDIMMNKT